MLWAALCDEASQSMNHCETLIARGQAAMAGVFQVLKESPDAFGAHIDDIELINRFVNPPGDKRHKQSQGIPIATLSITRQVALVHQMLKEESSNPRTTAG